jgi:16S rRNA (guanine(1405)-N(7))-methyltransferase
VSDTLGEVMARLAASRRYRHVAPAMLRRLAVEEQAHGGKPEEIAHRVRRRLHQALGAVAGPTRAAERQLGAVRDTWHGDSSDRAFRDACAGVLRAHASTRERVPHLDAFYAAIWDITGPPRTAVLDLGCGIGPLALPWMQLAEGVRYHACDVDGAALETVAGFLQLVGRPGEVEARDLVSDVAGLPAGDVALLLKLVPTLDRQDAGAAARLLRAVEAEHAVVSFPARSLGGRGKGMDRAYRGRLDRLLEEVGHVTEVREASVPNELVFVLELSRG